MRYFYFTLIFVIKNTLYLIIDFEILGESCCEIMFITPMQFPFHPLCMKTNDFAIYLLDHSRKHSGYILIIKVGTKF